MKQRALAEYIVNMSTGIGGLVTTEVSFLGIELPSTMCALSVYYALYSNSIENST